MFVSSTSPLFDLALAPAQLIAWSSWISCNGVVSNRRVLIGILVKTKENLVHCYFISKLQSVQWCQRLYKPIVFVLVRCHIIQYNSIIIDTAVFILGQVIPIEGNFKYNDEEQNTYQSIQTEIVVSM